MMMVLCGVRCGCGWFFSVAVPPQLLTLICCGGMKLISYMLPMVISLCSS